MKSIVKMSAVTAIAAVLTAPIAEAAARKFSTAEVTRIVRDVDLLLADQTSRPASVGSTVSGQTALQTGNNSRAQLSFPDESVVRLGSNSVFSFTAGQRDLNLDRGTMLLQAPKFRGKTQIKTAAVTAAITGTTIMLEFIPPEYDAAGNIIKPGIIKIIVIEGSLEFSFTFAPRNKMRLTAGEMVSFPSNAQNLPQKYVVDLKRLVTTSLLFDGGLGPLPSLNKVQRAISAQQGDMKRGMFVSAAVSNGRSPSAITQNRIRDARISGNNAPMNPPRPMVRAPRPPRDSGGTSRVIVTPPRVDPCPPNPKGGNSGPPKCPPKKGKGPGKGKKL